MLLLFLEPFMSDPSFNTPFGILILTKYPTQSGMATIGSPECRKVTIDAAHWTFFNESDFELGRIERDSIIGYLKMLPSPKPGVVQ